MKFLIDTHTFIWFINDSPELSKTAKDLIENDENDIFISIASLWELSIKTALGKLSIIGEYQNVIEDLIENDIEILSVNFPHTVIQNQLPFYHKDPFDRIIISQAIVENMNLISIDEIIDDYLHDQKITRIW